MHCKKCGQKLIPTIEDIHIERKWGTVAVIRIDVSGTCEKCGMKCYEPRFKPVEILE